MPLQPDLKDWKPTYSSDCRKEWTNARSGRKEFSKLYDAMCHYCGKNFLDVESKERHAGSHFLTVRGKGIRCNTCMQWFEVGKPFYRHFLGTHTGHGFYCLLKRCGKGFTDKKCVVDHHYVNHQYKEYTKLPRNYACETNFIRKNLLEPPRGKDPDPTGTIARLLQPNVFLRRLCDDEVEFYEKYPHLYPVQTPIASLDVSKVEDLRQELKEMCESVGGTYFKSVVPLGRPSRNVARRGRKHGGGFSSRGINRLSITSTPSNISARFGQPGSLRSPDAVIVDADSFKNAPVVKVMLSADLVNSLLPVKIPHLEIGREASADSRTAHAVQVVKSLDGLRACLSKGNLETRC